MSLPSMEAFLALVLQDSHASNLDPEWLWPLSVQRLPATSASSWWAEDPGFAKGTALSCPSRTKLYLNQAQGNGCTFHFSCLKDLSRCKPRLACPRRIHSHWLYSLMACVTFRYHVTVFSCNLQQI